MENWTPYSVIVAARRRLFLFLFLAGTDARPRSPGITCVHT
jgi:hypothetical protein